MTSDARPLAGPVTGSAWQCARPGQPGPLDAGTLALIALPTSPFWARTRDQRGAVRRRTRERANASLISLSIRHFRNGLLIEVHDTSSNPPVRSRAAQDAESGRGLMLVEALSREWSYFFPPRGGKVVYCFLEMR